MFARGRARLAAAGVGCALGGCLLSGCAPGGGPGTTGLTHAAAVSVGVTRYPQGSRPAIPDVRGRTLDGSDFRLSSLRGHVVVVNVWASWCGPCRTESPTLAKLSRSTAALGVRFVGIDEQDRASSARAFAARAGAAYPQVVDTDGATLASLRVVPASGIPSTLVLDRTGHVAARVIGPVDGSTLASVLHQAARES